MIDFDRSAFVGKFQEEACDLLQRLNEGFIELETADGDRDLVDRVLRDAHTLKGSSRMVGLIEISDVAHWLENLMVGVRDDGHVYSPQMSNVVFEALDAIAFLAEHAREDDFDHGIDLGGLQARLAALCEGNAVAVRAASDLATSREGEGVGSVVGDDANVVQPSRREQEDRLHDREQSTIRVKAAQVDGLLNLTSEVVISQSKAEGRSVVLRRFNSRLSDLTSAWMSLRGALHGETSQSSATDADVLPALSAALVSTVDSLLGELRRDLSIFAKRDAEDATRTSMLVHDLQEQGMRLRMLPVSTIFQTFPRAVRDMAREYAKEIDLVVGGGDTELDKKVLEALNDPLVHIIRNAVDHGIESPEVREGLGKPRCGTVRISARPEGDHIVVEIADDGAGIDPVKIRAAAVRRGYLTSEEASATSDREALFLIFEPGFSTSTIVTEMSGRGVGMDVVREFVVEQLKGSLDIHSKVNRGTTFTLTIPLTLAVIRALLCEVAGQVFALPTVAVDETFIAEPQHILKAEGLDVVRRGRRSIQLARLSDVLGLPSVAEDGSARPVVVVDYSGHRLGLVVDGFVGEQQIVIKPLGTHLAQVDNIAGVTVLGTGELVPILDLPDVVRNARLKEGRQRHAQTPAAAVSTRRRVLICEDSFTTRELERTIFESAGFDVHTAADGAAGLASLKDGLVVDAVVTDVQMPNMTGVELARAIKSDSDLKRIPVVIVTSLERDQEKADGIKAGADAYITKSVFNQATLLDTVEGLIGQPV